MWTLPTLCIIFVPIFPLVRFWIYREQIETRPSKSVRVWSKIFHGITTVAFFSDGLINFLLIPASPRVANGRRPLAAPASVASVGEALCLKIHFFSCKFLGCYIEAAQNFFMYVTIFVTHRAQNLPLLFRLPPWCTLFPYAALARASVASVGEALCLKIHFFFQVNSWVAM